MVYGYDSAGNFGNYHGYEYYRQGGLGYNGAQNGGNPIHFVCCIFWVSAVVLASLLKIITFPIYAPIRELYSRKYPPKGINIQTPAVPECKLGCKSRNCKTCIIAPILSDIKYKKGKDYGLVAGSKRLMTWRDKGSYDDGFSTIVTIIEVDAEKNSVDVQYDYGLIEHSVPFTFFDPIQVNVAVVVAEATLFEKDDAANPPMIALSITAGRDVHPESTNTILDADEWSPPPNKEEDLESQNTADKYYFCFQDNEGQTACFWGGKAGWVLQKTPGSDLMIFYSEGRYPSPMVDRGEWKQGAKVYKVDFLKVPHSYGDESMEAFAFRYHSASFKDPKYKDISVSGIYEEEPNHEYAVKGKKCFGRAREFRKGEMKEIFGNRLCYGKQDKGDVLDWLLDHSDTLMFGT